MLKVVGHNIITSIACEPSARLVAAWDDLLEYISSQGIPPEEVVPKPHQLFENPYILCPIVLQIKMFRLQRQSLVCIVH